jgi:hypothetical protein
MKQVLFFLLAGLFLLSCKQKDKMIDGSAKYSAKSGVDTTFNPADTTKWTTVKWENETYDFGKVDEGPKIEVSYRVTNTGKQPLVIEDVQKTCGCTETYKPEKPIMPGETGLIKAVFDTKGRIGAANKTIYVTYNSQGSPKSLTFSGEVLAPKKTKS